jgi:hypothetical protein
MFFPWLNPVTRLDKHADKVGSLYSQIDHKSFLARLIPLLFIVKRIFFAVGCWFIKTELVAIFGVITLLHICLIIFAKPYLEHSQYKLELFNEGIALVFFISLQAFKAADLINDPEKEYNFGWISTIFIIIYIFVHLANNFIPFVTSFYNKIKAKYCAKKKKANKVKVVEEKAQKTELKIKSDIGLGVKNAIKRE